MECGFFTNRFSRETLIDWINSSMSSKEYFNKYLKHGSVKPRKAWPEPDYVPPPENFKCPKSDKCVMDCYHKKPHAYEEKFCNDINGQCGVKCVHELISDCTFFEEDFEII